MSARSKLIMSVLALLAAVLAGVLGFENFGGTSDASSASVSATATSSGSASASAGSGSGSGAASAGSGESFAATPAETVAPRGVVPVPIPQQAFTTLKEIDNGGWPDSANAPGTKGGITWQNRGGDLPKADASGARITYQEWDVNPKKRGESRDAERIVTGSDGSAWYTGDHYTSFIRIR